MNIAIFCIFIASILPIVFVAFAKLTGGFKLGHNHHPRNFLNKLEGRASLAKSAHDNSWEAFAPFAVAVLACLFVGVSRPIVDQLAISFVVFRFIYGLAYIFDKPTIRSIIWFAAWSCVAILYYKAWSV
ncbi:MAG: MAPEG family protein [Bacteriovoracaceae bacterium]|nr:MAPEG family protein [Bacteriovoracaceae bacterium]